MVRYDILTLIFDVSLFSERNDHSKKHDGHNRFVSCGICPFDVGDNTGERQAAEVSDNKQFCHVQ